MMANVLQSRIFRDEADFIQKLIQYSQIEQHLQPNTLFATIRITNPQSIVSHASLVETLGYFMRNNLVSNAIQYTSMRPGIPQYITMSTVTKLTELFLQHNLFYYQGKIYEFKKSGPHSLRLSDDLLNIYLFAWQQSVFGHERLKLELHGRYGISSSHTSSEASLFSRPCSRHRHTLFMTWNQSEAELRQFLRSSTERYPSIQLQTTIGRSVQFLNTHIENRQGRLYTRLAHASDTEPYSLPFVVGDAQVEHGRWLQAALTRAGQVCSNVFDFVEERIHLEMACLLAGYSLEFVEVHLRHFFQSSNTETIRFSMHASAYELFRRHSLGIAEQQRTALDKYQALEDKERVLHLHFLRDYGSWNRFHQRFHQIWTNYLHEDADLSNEKTKIILHAKHVYSLNALLAQQKPSIALLNVRPA